MIPSETTGKLGSSLLHFFLRNLNRTLENTIEHIKNTIETQNGVSSLVAKNHVTTSIPAPYTALKAEKIKSERTTGFASKS